MGDPEVSLHMSVIKLLDAWLLADKRLLQCGEANVKVFTCQVTYARG